MPEFEETVDLVEAAARLRISYHLAHKYVLIGRLKGQRVAGRWRVDLKDLVRVEHEQVRCPAGAA